MFHNKTSVFTAYAAIAVVGFGGVALLNFAGKSTDNNALVAFLGFYGFFCTTAIFYVLGKQKATIENLHEYINGVNDSHCKENDAIYRRIGDVQDEAARDLNDRVNGIWMTLDRVQDDVADCRVPCGKK
jgi:hypothetical protein